MMTFGHFWSLAKFSKINMGMRKNQHLRRLSLIIDGMKGTTITEKIIMEEKCNTGKMRLFSVNTDLEEIYLSGAEIHISEIVDNVA